MSLEHVIEAVLPLHIKGMDLQFQFQRNTDRARYELVLMSPNHVTQGYDYSTHYLADNIGTYGSTTMARMIDEYLSNAVKEHHRLFFAESMTTPEVPLFSEAVVGYRRWKLEDWVLAPTNYGSPWRPGVNTAKCQPGSVRGNSLRSYFDEGVPHGNPPAKDCHCGLNAFFDPKGDSWRQHGGLSYVVGAIVGWGDLQVHPDGFRAQYAQIVALVRMGNINDPTNTELDEVAALYNVPLVDSIEELQIEASKHGSPLPESLRPAEQVDENNARGGGYLTSYAQALKQVWGSNQGWVSSSGGTLPPPTVPSSYTTTRRLSAAERQAEMVEAARKANLTEKKGAEEYLKADTKATKERALERARKKHEAQQYLEVKNPKKKPWRV